MKFIRNIFTSKNELFFILRYPKMNLRYKIFIFLQKIYKIFIHKKILKIYNFVAVVKFNYDREDIEISILFLL